MAEEFERKPLVLPHNDGEDDFAEVPIRASRYIEFAERFRRQGLAIAWPFIGTDLWGKALAPVRLRLDPAVALNLAVWYRDQEPVNLSSFSDYFASMLPHPQWKWRITCEPKGLSGALYEIDNPAASDGSGASVMAEDLISSEGELENLPVPFSAPNPSFAFVGNLQAGYTTDGGTTIVWLNPIWN